MNSTERLANADTIIGNSELHFSRGRVRILLDCDKAARLAMVHNIAARFSQQLDYVVDIRG